MQAITTKILPATNNRPTRCKATAAAGSITIGIAHSTEEAHNEAAKALCSKFNWEGYLVMGTMHGGDNVFVFMPDSVKRHVASMPMWDDGVIVASPIQS